jgi:hypothetical protein
LIVQSAEALAIHFPSGENFTAETPFLWPWSIRAGV